MLDKLRNSINGVVAKTFIFLLIAAFVLVGIAGVLSGGSGDVVATVGDKNITVPEFQEIYRRVSGRLPDYSESQLQSELLRRLVIEKLLLSAAEDRNYDVSSSSIIEQIKEDDKFKNSDGGFDINKYNSFLQMQRLTENDLAENIKKDVVIQFLIDPLTSQINTSDAEVKLLYRYYKEQRKLSTLHIPADYVKDVSKPSESEIADYYEKNNENYKTKELRSIDYSVVDCKKADISVEVSDADLQETYEGNLSEGVYNQVRAYDIKQLLVNEDSDIESVKAKIAANVSFDDITKGYGSDKISEIPNIKETELFAEIKDALSGLEEGGHSGIIKTALGSHIIQVKKIHEPREISFADVKEDIKAELIEENRCDLVDEEFKNIEDEFAGGATLSEVAADNKLLTVKSLSKVSGIADAAVKENLHGDIGGENVEYVLGKMFEVEDGSDPMVYSPGDGVYIAFHVTEVVEPKIPELAEIKADVVKSWLSDEKKAKSHVVAQEQAKLISEGGDIKKIASKLGLTVKDMFIERANRRFNSDIPEGIYERIFSAEAGYTSDVYENYKGEFVILRLDKVNPANLEAAKHELESLTATMSQEWFDILFDLYMVDLRKKYPVDILYKFEVSQNNTVE